MIISKVLYTSKKLKDGTHPIMIRFQAPKQSPKYVSTGFSVSKSYWSKKSGLTQKSREADNRKIDEILRKYQARKDEIESNGQEATYELLLSDQKIDKKKNKNNFIEIVRMKAKTYTKYNSRKEFDDLADILEELYGDYIDVNEINQFFLDDFQKLVDNKFGDKTRKKNIVCQKFVTSYEYAKGRDLVEKHRPLKYKVYKHYKKEEGRDLDPTEISALINAYKKDCILKTRIKKNHKDAMMLWMLHLAFQGVAPVDMGNLKVGDFKFDKVYKIRPNIEKYNNEPDYKEQVDRDQEVREVVKLRFNRDKTSTPVTVVVDRESVEPLLEYYIYGRDKNEYVLPIRKEGMDNETFTKKRKSYYGNKIKRINVYMKWYCKFFEVPPLQHITYYQARHAFINMLNDLDPHKFPQTLLKRMVGQLDDVMNQYYIKPVDEWICTEATREIFNQGYTTIKQLMEERVS